jgi:hypothetical protein
MCRCGVVDVSIVGAAFGTVVGVDVCVIVGVADWIFVGTVVGVEVDVLVGIVKGTSVGTVVGDEVCFKVLG